MLSAWRKLTRKQDDREPVFPTGIMRVDQTMQKKFSKGVQYNMKIIIKGDRNTGKSTLLERLSGADFREAYIPTHEIQVKNINWNYRGACDIVKVEVWDIVDKSKKKRTPSGSLKIANTEDVKTEEEDGLALDAELINVYQGTHGVILTVDITKAWTWQYVQRELDKIPCHIPVLVLGNFRDIGEHRVIQTDEIISYLKYYERPSGSAEIYFTESSMKNGFGLKFIYKFLNMPFLILQREALLKQLKANALEIEDMREMLCIDLSSEEQNYELFHDIGLKQVEPTLLPSPEGKEKEVNQELEVETVEAKVSSNKKEDKSVKRLPVATVPPTVIENKKEDQPTPEVQNTVAVKNEKPKPKSRFQEYKAKLFGSEPQPRPEPEPVEVVGDIEDVVPIDDFQPGSLDDSFLANNAANKTQSISSTTKQGDSDSDSSGNPMVAGYEDLESDNDDVDGGVFQQQVSHEADFDDLSDDEKPRMEENNVSIIDQIKSTRKKNQIDDTEPDDYHVLSDELDIEEAQYDGIDNNENINTHTHNNIDTQLDNHAEQHLDNTSKSHYSDTAKLKNKNIENEINIKESNKINKQINSKTNKITSSLDKESCSEEEQEESEVYVIAGDVDVDDYDDDGIHDDNDDDRDEKDDTTNIVDQICEDMKNKDANESSTKANDVSVSFDLDDLEMFMNTQMQKTDNKTEAEPSPGNLSKSTEPKKKKKKKKSIPVEESVDIGEKRTKKKKPKKPVASNDNESQTETVKKTKKAKTKSSETSSAERREKKKKSVAQSEKSDLDAFLDGF